jgi:GT2 family glycosyltransferase
MSVRLCLTTMNRPELLVRAVDAALKSDIPLDITVIDNSPEHYAEALVGDRATVLTMPVNIGLPRAVNLFFALYSDYIIISNDDIAVDPHTIRAMVEAAEARPDDALFFEVEAHFSFFLLKKWAFLAAGPVDTAFWPLYYDDCCLAYRLKLLGLLPVVVTAATLHHEQSATLKAYDEAGRLQHDENFLRNQAYYVKKWGGLPGHETFTLPFDGKEQ